MLLFYKIFLAHTLDSIIFVVLFVLAEHDLAKRSSSQNLQKLKLLKSRNIIFISFTLEDNFAFGLNLLILFDALSIKVETLYGMHFFNAFIHIIYSCCV